MSEIWFELYEQCKDQLGTDNAINKNNDKIIIDYLNATYNSSSAIKHILYEYITKGSYTEQKGDNLDRNYRGKIEHKDVSSTQKVIKEEIKTFDEIIIDDDIRNMFG